jgi:uncharacterized RDD family membrane protein YckC
MVILDQTNLSETPMQYANFGERLIARLIDGFIVFIPSIFLPLIAPWLYFALQEGNQGGATVGKRIMGIRVLSTDGRAIGFGTATGRFFCHFINLFTMGLGYLLMLFNARNQGLHDMITSTVVVRTASSPPVQQTTQRRGKDQHSWSKIVSDQESHFVEINTQGGRHRHRMNGGEQVRHFTLWQMTDGMIDFSAAFDSEEVLEMKRFAEYLLKNKFNG